MSGPNGRLLTVRDLRTHFPTADGLVKAVDGVSFGIDTGQTFALVGESGCGKSQTAFSILRILQHPGRVAGGSVVLEGQDLLALSERRMRAVRGGKISMIFQEPMTSLNPVYTVGYQIIEAIRLHRPMSPSAAFSLGVEMLENVGIPEPAQRMNEYPHQLSGGMRQRAMIAMALSCNPRLLIADEPTTALDVTIQAQILELLRELQDTTGLSIMLITHDLAVVAETAHVVAVMYASKLVELSDVDSVFHQPLHPYTRGLFRSLPRLGQTAERLETIPGNVPNPLSFPPGCKFHPRCDVTRTRANEAAEADTTTLRAPGEEFRVLRRCAEQEPALREVRQGHWCACWECPGYQAARQTDPTAAVPLHRRAKPAEADDPTHAPEAGPANQP